MIISHKNTFGHVLSQEEAPYYFAEAEHKANEVYRLTEHQARKQSWRKRGHLHASEFILRIKRMNPLIFVQRQINFPNEWGLYIDVRGNLTYLSCFRKGYVPEYSYTLVDEHDLEIEEVRGWRTCLVRLMNYGVITWSQVQKEFKDCPGNGGAKWRYATRFLRTHNGCRIAARNLTNKLS